jgi:ATP-dependent DNA ligase
MAGNGLDFEELATKVGKQRGHVEAILAGYPNTAPGKTMLDTVDDVAAELGMMLALVPRPVALAGLPRPMLARSGPLPTRPGWSFEPKWDGFRAIVRMGDGFEVRSRGGWEMTELLWEFASQPVRGVFDGELVAFDLDGVPSFQLLCRRMLEGDRSISVVLVLFDVLELDGEDTMPLPYVRRRELLESLTFGDRCLLSPRFDDGAALWESVVARRLEGVVAKSLVESYRPGERAWIKKKNPGWPRYEAEREAVIGAASRSRHGP